MNVQWEWQNNWLFQAKSDTVSHNKIGEGPCQPSSQPIPFITFWKVLKNDSLQV